MVDETTVLSNTEQMVLCLRHVDDDLNVHGELIGLYSLESTSAENIMLTIQDILLRLNLSINNCRGQCYDGASNMSGIRSGVATKVSSLEPRALYTHCHRRQLPFFSGSDPPNLKGWGDPTPQYLELSWLQLISIWAFSKHPKSKNYISMLVFLILVLFFLFI